MKPCCFAVARMAVTLLACATLVLPAAARSASLESTTTVSANELLRQAIVRQKAPTAEYYTWLDRVQKPRGSVTKLMINTPHGLLARTVARNDHPLTADEQQIEETRLHRLLDAARMREKANRQHADAVRVDRLVAALPEAFACQYGTARDERIVRLDCDPNPAYQPPNYETQILVGMKAAIFIDRDDLRLVRIYGTLFKDVNFGWGVIGRLYRGGHIEIAQGRISPRFWGISRMQLVFDGRAVLVKRMHLEIAEQEWDYRSVPALNTAQALDFLRNHAARLETSAKFEPPH